MIGTTILHYKILEKLGEGGMGIVYLAEDIKLKRQVAIKFLPHHISASEEERKRFEIEAQASASLNHPNIATIYSIEESDDSWGNKQTFIVMEYIEGKELKSIVETHRDASLPIKDIINYAIQLAEGLEAAHKKEIVHRDIKSQNIMITEDGKVKIMDFGLAKMKDSTNLTTAGTTVGTIVYMSPEQAAGGKIDHRTDIWSYGVVLYEMLTGNLPFRGDYDQAVIYSIINQEQESLPSDLNKYGLEDILKKLLAKEKEKRYQKMTEVLEALKKLKEKNKDLSEDKNSETDSRSSIAVLPFINMSNDPEQDYFCDGISEEIINALAQLKNLRVIARTSAFSFKGKNSDAREIGKILDVNTLLEGSVRKAGNRLRITTQLVKVSDGSHLWSSRYDRVLEDIFSIQEDIAGNVASALRGFLTKEEKSSIQRPETKIEAYEYFLKGRNFLHQLFLIDAKEQFEQAIELDPEYAPAYAGLADTHAWIYEWEAGKENDLLLAEKYSLKALELAPELSESHSSRGYVLSLAKKYDEAEKEFLEAIRLNPNSFNAFYLYGRTCFSHGEIEKSAEMFLKASEIRREDFQSTLLLAQSLRLLGKDDGDQVLKEGINRVRKQITLNPNDRRALSLGAGNLVEIGEKEEAFKWINRAVDLYPDDAGVLINASCLFAKAGEKEKALNFIEKAFSRGYGKREWIEHDPDYDSLRAEPRFKELLKKLK